MMQHAMQLTGECYVKAIQMRPLQTFQASDTQLMNLLLLHGNGARIRTTDTAPSTVRKSAHECRQSRDL